MAPGRMLGGAIRNLSLKALSIGLERVCRLVVVVAVAPVLGEAAFGRFVFASTVTALLALGTDLGLGVWTTRALARCRVDSDAQLLAGRGIVQVGLAIRSLAALPYAVAVLAVAMFAARGEARAAIILLGIAALVNAFLEHFAAIFRGYERFGDEARVNAFRALLFGVAGLTTLTVARSLIGLCSSIAAANLGGGLYGAVVLRRLHPFARQVRIERPKLDRVLAKAALAQALPLWFAGLCSMLYFKIDTLFLRSMAGDAELGLYGAAFKIFEGAMILPSVLLSVTFPQLARAHGHPPIQRRLERQIGLLLLGLGLLVGATCFVGGTPLIRGVFGTGFGRAVPSMRVLALGMPLLFLNYGLTHFLVARDMGTMTQRLALAMLVLNVLLDLALIPRAHGPGAAWATVLTELALTACCLGALRLTVASQSLLPSIPTAPRIGQKAV